MLFVNTVMSALSAATAVVPIYAFAPTTAIAYIVIAAVMVTVAVIADAIPREQPN